MGGKSTDFGDVAVSQGEENEQVVRDQLYANRPDQTTPWGYTTWDSNAYTDPVTGETTTQWDQTTGLTPELMDIYNKEVAIQGGMTDIAGTMTGRLGEEFSTGADYSGLNPMGEVPIGQYTLPEGEVGDPYETRQSAEDAMYSSAMSRIEPEQESDRAALELQMRNQGLGPGDAAWTSQIASQDAAFTDQTNQAIWDSVGEGREESGQMYDQLLSNNENTYNQALGSNAQNYDMSMSNSQYANEIRQQQIAEEQNMRGYDLNEINALLGGTQVGLPDMPDYTQSGVAEATPLLTGAAQDASGGDPYSSLLSGGGSILGGYLAG